MKLLQLIGCVFCAVVLCGYESRENYYGEVSNEIRQQNNVIETSAYEVVEAINDARESASQDARMVADSVSRSSEDARVMEQIASDRANFSSPVEHKKDTWRFHPNYINQENPRREFRYLAKKYQPPPSMKIKSAAGEWEDIKV